MPPEARYGKDRHLQKRSEALWKRIAEQIPMHRRGTLDAYHAAEPMFSENTP